MRFAKKLMASVVFLSLGQSTTAQPSCTLFEHHDYLGRMIALSDGQCVRDMRAYDFNDIGSSVLVSEGCEARLYEHIEFYGCGVFYNVDTPKFADVEGEVTQCDVEATGAKENDRASSMICICNPEVLKNAQSVVGNTYAECEVIAR